MTDKREAIPKNLGTIFRVADQLVADENTLPALILVYASIDILASLQRLEGEGTRKAFVRWADTYLLPDSGIDCTGIDLYAARCGILHTLTPDADLVKKGEASKVLYAFGKGEPRKLVEASRRLGYDHAVVHVGNLHEAVKRGAGRFLEECESDEELAAQVEKAATQWLTDVRTTTIDLLLELTQG